MRVPIRFVLLALLFGEIAGFILVGKAIGVLPTLGLVFAGTAGGLALLRAQGVATLLRVRAEAAAGRTPARPLAEGAVKALGALLLILPGFISDLVGLLLMVPQVRQALLGALGRRFTFAGESVRRAGTGVVDLDRGEYSAHRRRSDEQRGDAQPSPWQIEDRGPPPT